MTRDEFIERRRERATRKGADPNRAAAKAARQFDMMDTNHNGVIDPGERAAWKAARGGNGRDPMQGPPR
jgi:hypothetical protein